MLTLALCIAQVGDYIHKKEEKKTYLEQKSTCKHIIYLTSGQKLISLYNKIKSV